MNLAKLPYYKMYPSDADTDENFRLMSLEQRGAFWTLLNHSWLNDGIPADLEDIRNLLQTTPENFAQIWPRLAKCFAKSGNRLRNSRQENERKSAESKSAKSSNSANMRYERSANAPLRASDSEYEYKELKALEQEKPKVHLSPRQNFSPPLETKTERTSEQVWADAGFEDFEDFTGWFEDLYRKHPTRGAPGIAKQGLMDAVLTGKLRRSDFDAVYAAYCACRAWQEDRGKFIPALSRFVTDKGWLYPPVEVVGSRTLSRAEQVIAERTESDY